MPAPQRRATHLVTPMLVAPGDRAGRVPGSLDALDLLVDLARGRAERVDADLAVRHTGAQRAYLGCGVVLRHAEAERLVLQLGEIRWIWAAVSGRRASFSSMVVRSAPRPISALARLARI